MAWQTTPYLVPLVFSVGISIAIAGVAWRLRDHAGARWLGVLTWAIAWWSVTYLVSLSTTDLSLKLLAHDLMYPAIGLVPVAWVVFAIEYTGRIRPLSRREIVGLSIVPAATTVLLWTNEAHGLVWTSTELVASGSAVVLSTTKGPWFWLFVAYTYLLLATGTVLVLQMALLADHVYRGQAIALGVAVLIPWGANVLYHTGTTGVWDPTNLGFALGGAVLVGAVFRRQLLQLVPLAREVARNELIASMAEPVVVVDEHEQIADLNPAAEALLDRPSHEALGAGIETVFPTLAEAIDPGTGARTREEITIEGDDRDRQYEVQTVPLRRGYGAIAGQLLTLRDVTARYEREQRLRRQRQQLEVLNRVLRHDIRNGMNVILGHVDQVPEETDGADRSLRAIETKGQEIVNLSETARRFESVIGGDGMATAVVDVVSVLDRVTSSLSLGYPDAEIETDLPERARIAGTELVSFAIRNVVQNALEHNDRDRPRVEISVETDEAVTVRVADDGPGLPAQERAVIERRRETPLEHSNGFGLWLTTWIIEDAGGEVAVADNEPRGTVVTLRFPPPDRDPGDPA